MTTVSDQFGLDQPPYLFITLAIVNRSFNINNPDLIHIRVEQPLLRNRPLMQLIIVCLNQVYKEILIIRELPRLYKSENLGNLLSSHPLRYD
jgi:hypothetical protein